MVILRNVYDVCVLLECALTIDEAGQKVPIKERLKTNEKTTAIFSC